MMDVELGMPTLIELESVEDNFALCERLGLSFVELNMNLPACQPGRLNLGLLRNVKERGLYVTIHLDENLNPFDFNLLLSEAYTRVALEAIALAKAIGAPVANMHMARGVYFTLPEREVYLYERYFEAYAQRVRDFRDACERAAGQAGPQICIENTDGYKAFQRTGIELLLESPAFALTLDIGHNHDAGGVDEAFYRRHGDCLIHMHAHDAKGGRAHLVLGEGEIELPKWLSLAERRGCRCVLETKTAAGLAASIQYLRDHGHA